MAHIATDDSGIRWIEWYVAAGADAGVEDATAQSLKQLRAYMSLAEGLADEIEDIVIARNAFVEVPPVSHDFDGDYLWRLTHINVLCWLRHSVVPKPAPEHAMPVENIIVLLIVAGAMVAFMLVIAWLSLDRNKLPRDDHGAAE